MVTFLIVAVVAAVACTAVTGIIAALGVMSRRARSASVEAKLDSHVMRSSYQPPASTDAPRRRHRDRRVIHLPHRVGRSQAG